MTLSEPEIASTSTFDTSSSFVSSSPSTAGLSSHDGSLTSQRRLSSNVGGNEPDFPILTNATKFYMLTVSFVAPWWLDDNWQLREGPEFAEGRRRNVSRPLQGGQELEISFESQPAKSASSEHSVDLEPIAQEEDFDEFLMQSELPILPPPIVELTRFSRQSEDICVTFQGARPRTSTLRSGEGLEGMAGQREETDKLEDEAKEIQKSVKGDISCDSLIRETETVLENFEDDQGKYFVYRYLFPDSGLMRLPFYRSSRRAKGQES